MLVEGMERAVEKAVEATKEIPMEIVPTKRRGRPKACHCATPAPYPANSALCMTCSGKIYPPKEATVTEPGPVTEVVGVTEPEMAEVVEELSRPQTWSPPSEVFLNLKGKLYLPARRRVQWMRGEPVPHPDWTIDTEVVEHNRGKFIRPGRVEGGYALVRANIFDETGRLIATGVKSEYSENFADYIEKAETGAIARAAAVAGYGTEAALDFDEGAVEGRPADSPLDPATGRLGGGPELGAGSISITTATALPTGRGGAPTTATRAQIRKVSALSSGLGLGTGGLVGVINGVLADGTEQVLDPDLVPTASLLVEWMEKQSAVDLGKIIVALELARDAQPE